MTTIYFAHLSFFISGIFCKGENGSFFGGVGVLLLISPIKSTSSTPGLCSGIYGRTENFEGEYFEDKDEFKSIEIGLSLSPLLGAFMFVPVCAECAIKHPP